MTRGKSKNFDPEKLSVFGVGCIGSGDYTTGGDNKTRVYRVWQGMMWRCYSSSQPVSYAGCTVHDDWLNFQNFARDYFKMFDHAEDDWQLDKDILVKNNKIYSVETCVACPSEINKIFQRSRGSRGKYPLGVSWHKNHDVFSANMQVEGRTKFLGHYINVGDAFMAYKTFKERYIKEVAEEYKEIISDKLYEALLNYEISIND
jgi:outer membrane receptor for ferric coprogen and ferric-rhodotorulic acid